MKKLAHYLLILPLLYGCTKTDPKEAVVQIGTRTISKVQNEAFEKVVRMYPTDPGSYYPNYRSNITHLIEVEIIYNQIPAKFRDSLKSLPDWKLKEQYYPAQMFLLDYLSSTLGIPDAQVTAYYNTHKDAFKVTVTNDSTKKDSSYFRPLTDVRSQIIDTLFIQANKPDSAFLKRFEKDAQPAYIADQWLGFIRQTLPNFFMKKIYKEVMGKPFPDSLSEIYGNGKYITKADFNVIINWIPEARRNLYDVPERQRELVEWLVKWKLFSNYAQAKRLLDVPTLKYAMEWAWKMNAVYAYINAVMVPIAESTTKVDTAMLLYSLYDDNGYSPIGTHDNALAAKALSHYHELAVQKIDSMIMNYRQKVPVTILLKDLSDPKCNKPDSLFKVANTFRDSGKTNEAKDLYSTISQNFAFTSEGKSSLIECAKLQTEQQLYSQAISNYRKYLITSGDTEKRCNTFFMIGFIYDEYLDKPLNAESNYKWVLKNAPGCELADDAEFMMLHLNEPMSSVEELRDEATRQGRKVEANAEVAATDTLK